MKRLLTIVGILVFLAWGFWTPHGTLPPVGPDPYGLLVPSAFAQTAPASAVPDPSSTFGTAVTAYALTTGGGAMTLMPAASGRRNYVYFAKCDNTSGGAVEALIKDSTTTIASVSCPASAAANAGVAFNPPLRVTSGNAVTMTVTSAVTTAYFYMSGYTGLR